MDDFASTLRFAPTGPQDVFHWNLATANSQPEKIFQRAGKLAESGTQIINYTANSQASQPVSACLFAVDFMTVWQRTYGLLLLVTDIKHGSASVFNYST